MSAFFVGMFAPWLPMRLKLLFLLFITTLAGCQFLNRTPESPALTRERFVYAGPGRCDTSANGGVSVKVDFVLLKADEKNAPITNDTLRAQVMRSITGWLDSASLAQQPQAQTNLDVAANVFSANYQQLKEDVGIMGGCWEIDIKGDTICSNPHFLTVGLETYAYTGGAHPNTYRTLLSFDRHTGQPLHLTDLVTDTTGLLPLVEQAFRAKQGVRSDQSLEEEGYFLQEGRFFLPENVAAGRDGLIFYYNPYEIAAYAFGPIEVVVPYKKLKTLLNGQ